MIGVYDPWPRPGPKAKKRPMLPYVAVFRVGETKINADARYERFGEWAKKLFGPDEMISLPRMKRRSATSGPFFRSRNCRLHCRMYS